VAISTVFDMIALIEPVNHGSRPRSRVTVATTATSIAGSAATRLKRLTIRVCSPAPAAPARRARMRLAASQATMPMRMTASTTLKSKSARTTSFVGRMGVIPPSTRNVAKPDRRAAVTASVPIQPGPRLASPGGVIVRAGRWSGSSK
jgi:hypothetical protein